MNTVRYRIPSWIVLAATAAVGCAADAGDTPHEESGSGLSVRLAALEPGSGRIEYSLTNHGAEPLRVLVWKTGLHPAPDPLFEISQDGSAVQYAGPILHRARVPSPSSYVEVAPGQRLSAAVDLTQFYDLRKSGVYEVRLRPLHSGFVLGSEAVRLDTDASVRIEVDAGHGGPVAVHSQALNRASCTAEDFDKLRVAEDQAHANLQEATQHFAANGYDERARRWFGTNYNEQDSNYVRKGLFDTLGWFERGNIEYVCGAGGWCDLDTNTVAWVDPIFSPGVINLCDRFWTEPDTAACARAVILTHEAAHFHTRWLDLAYFPRAALKLAKDRPAWARSNAENYALYTIDSQIPPEPPPDEEACRDAVQL